ncbi:MAG TPA: hypothetical protein VGK99_18150 [Acidobacteriota bacterium]|jgi:hypothetical protein
MKNLRLRFLTFSVLTTVFALFSPLWANTQLMVLHQDGVGSQSQLQFDSMKKFIRALPGDVDLAVAYFGHGSLSFQSDFTSNHELAARSMRVPLSSASQTSGTYDSLVEAVKKLSQRDGQKILVFFSDGVDTLRDMLTETPDQNPMLVKAVKLAKENNVRIYAVYTQAQPFAARERFAGTSYLNYLARNTGGKAFLETTISYDPVFSQIKRDLVGRY